MNPPPATVAQRAEFDAIVDVRSPAEYAEDHLPGAINLPVLDDEERARVGTIYTQASPFEARRIGSALVGRNIARHLEHSLADKPKHWRPLVYCWRGGQRSGSFVVWARMVGWDARQLGDGYTSWRRHVIAQIDALPGAFDWRVIAGATGSGKTRVLQALQAADAQVLDLEALAAHKGSVLGALGASPQPSQKAFETQLSERLAAFSPARPVYVEAESRRIGRLHLPGTLVDAMRASRCIALQAEPVERIGFLLHDYAELGEDRAALQAALGGLRGLHSHATLEQWLQWAGAGQLEPLIAALLEAHYDPAYRRSQRGSFLKLADAAPVVLDRLDDAGFAAAREVLALG